MTAFDPLLLLPDFLLILTGFGLCRFSSLQRPVWEVVERLVYNLLFPALRPEKAPEKGCRPQYPRPPRTRLTTSPVDDRIFSC